MYCIFGSIFLNFFYDNSFKLYINGNGGFVGDYLNQSLFKNIILVNKDIFYYLLVLVTSFLFLISINFSLKKIYQFLKKILNKIFQKKEKNYTDKSEIINEYIPQDEIKNLIQEDLPFIKADKVKNNEKTKFKLPDIDFLKFPTKKKGRIS